MFLKNKNLYIKRGMHLFEVREEKLKEVETRLNNTTLIHEELNQVRKEVSEEKIYFLYPPSFQTQKLIFLNRRQLEELRILTLIDNSQEEVQTT